MSERGEYMQDMALVQLMLDQYGGRRHWRGTKRRGLDRRRARRILRRWKAGRRPRSFWGAPWEAR